MDARLDVLGNPVSGKFLKHIISAGKPIADSTLPHATQELVKLRASQINGCGFCTDMHSKDAALAGFGHVDRVYEEVRILRYGRCDIQEIDASGLGIAAKHAVLKIGQAADVAVSQRPEDGV